MEPYLQVLVIEAASDEERTQRLNAAIQQTLREGLADQKTRTLRSVQFDSSIEDSSRAGSRLVLTVLLWFDQQG
jgi:hypothetical protein